MIDRKKIIIGLECWADPNPYINTVDCMLKNCPYAGNDHCDLEIFNGALELLKAQEPRVLTLEEVQNDCPDYVYLEWQNCCVCCIKDGGESNKKAVYFACGIEGYYYQMLWDSYGIRWRCWTAMPTDEQRKAVKWE